MASEKHSLFQIHPNRNYGIDLLRVIAMLYVVILHSLGAGGVLETAAEGSITYKTAWAVEIAAFGAVNIFAIISGYVSYSETDKPINLKNYLSLWTWSLNSAPRTSHSLY